MVNVIGNVGCFMCQEDYCLVQMFLKGVKFTPMRGMLGFQGVNCVHNNFSRAGKQL